MARDLLRLSLALLTLLSLPALVGSAGSAFGAGAFPLPAPSAENQPANRGAAPAAPPRADASPAASPASPAPEAAAAVQSAPSPAALQSTPSPAPVLQGAPTPSPSVSPQASPAPARKGKPRPKASVKARAAGKGRSRKKAQPTPSPSASPTFRKKKTAAPVHRYLPQLLQEVEALYSQSETLQADFTQVNEIAALQQKKTTSGVILFKRPDKIRWETQKPDQNLLVSDGRKFWFYTPPFDESEHGQVIERRTAEVQSRLAQALLSGRFSVARDMKISQERATEFVLKPKPGSAGTVIEARIEIDPIKRTINKVALRHKGGNRTEIALTGIQLGKPIDDEAFEFTPPPNTDLVTQ